MASIPTGQPRALLLLTLTLAGLTAGIGLWWLGSSYAGIAWSLATAPVLAVLLVQIVLALRQRQFGLDIVAALSMSAALAFGEPLAANVVALMYSGGQLLEAYAQNRARAEMTALLGRVARTAMVYRSGRLLEIDIGSIRRGDRLLIRAGEVLPVDGVVADGSALLDMSALTGESLPKSLLQGEEAMSGTTSVGQAFDIIATRAAADSTYSGIVRLVEDAQARKAPMVRTADRFALIFLVLTLGLAGGAWAGTGDPIRALAVLVVATPCPLILAVPVALISGLSRSARSGVLIKSGGVIERMARIRTAIFDKTGTLTRGVASVRRVHLFAGWREDEVIRLAGGLELASGHVIAEALADEAERRGIHLPSPVDVVETPGAGLEGHVDGRHVIAGSPAFVADRGIDVVAGEAPDSAMVVAVAVDGRPAGLIEFADNVRHDASTALQHLRRAGVEKIILASGDGRNIAAAIGRELGVDDAYGELTPGQKVDLVMREERRAPVMMIGDGVNDAPALAAASVGVAMGARGAAASSEAADVVLLIDELAPLGTALHIAHRTRDIALQSVFWGLGLSVVAMLAAAFGFLSPLGGALLQEAIDVAAILNALRALRIAEAPRLG